LHSPLRSEADAFRWAVVIGIGGASVVALALITRPVVGVIWAAALLVLGAGLAWRGSRGSLARRTEVSRAGDGKHRVLVVANETIGGRAVLAEIQNRSRGRRSEILVVTPALMGSRAANLASDVDVATAEARQRMELSLQALDEAGLRARGQVGDPDPNVALEDALRIFAADEIVISTHPPDRSHRLERGVVQRAREETDLPVTHVVVDLGG
jgi:hypothetical protein